MKRSAIIIALIMAFVWFLPTEISAQGTGKRKRNHTEWIKEMRRYKAEFVAEKLELTQEQRNEFIPMYQEMETKTWTIEHEARDMERSVRKKGAEATDTEYEKAAEALTEVKAKQGQIESEYLKKFRKILTPAQQFKMRGIEREFMRQLMERNRAGKRR